MIWWGRCAGSIACGLVHHTEGVLREIKAGVWPA